MIKKATIQDLEQWLKTDDVILIDVREAEEWAAGHIEGAVHLPLSAIEAQHINGIDPADVAGRKVVFQCKVGGRSLRAAHIFQTESPQQDFYNLEGGILAWEAASLDIEK